MPSIRILTVLLLSTSLATATSLVCRQDNGTSTNETACTWPEEKLGIAQVMKNWGTIWKGNTSTYLIEHTIMPNVSLWADRLPSGADYQNMTTKAVDIRDSEALLDYLFESRTGFSEYGFISNFNVVDRTGTKLVSRWTLSAVIGEGNPSKRLKVGDHLSMNGTDIIEFDQCSGRILQIWSAQDSMNYAFQMGQIIYG